MEVLYCRYTNREPVVLILSMKVYRRGFTLIETLLYIAIFGIVLVAGISASYNLIESTNRFNKKILVESEANFALRKLSLALENVSVVTAPLPPGTVDDQLEVLRSLPSGTEIQYFTTSGGQLFLEVDAGGAVPLTTSRVIFDNLNVVYIDNSSDGLAGEVRVDFQINGKSFSLRKFLRTDNT
jgi:prepilin-type N-terminal cleavage/methylation domain-containing protein